MSGTAVVPKARMNHPVYVVPEALTALQALGKALEAEEGPHAVAFGLAQLRASQINGCTVCVDLHVRLMKRLGETEDRLMALAVWRDSPLFTAEERAALDLGEAMTRFADRPEPVSEAVWAEAARLFSERDLARLVLGMASINAWNRINVATRQQPVAWPSKGDWKAKGESSEWAKA